MNPSTPRSTHEHEFEPEHGLPERLPEGEHILWQGTSDWRDLARRVFHADKVAIYFALMLAWRAGSVLTDGDGAVAALRSILWLAPLATFGVGLLLLLAWLTARTTVYTLTDRRIVMRIGIVLTVTYNLPLVRIEAADLRDAGGGRGDIALTLERPTRIAWLHLWPHVRPWRVSRAQPMLRALVDAEVAAAALRKAWSAANATAPRPVRATAPAAVGGAPVMIARQG